MPEKFSVGRTFRARFRVDASTVDRFAELSGDRNPIHVDSREAEAYGYPHRIAHGAILIAFLSRMIGTEVPGPGAVWMSQSVEWAAPVFVDDEIELAVTVKHVSLAAGIVSLDAVATNEKGQVVMKGNAMVKLGDRVAGSNPDGGRAQRVALVTGGSRGIGNAIARRLAAGSLAVIVNYRESRETAKQVVEEIQAAGGSALAIAADLGDATATSEMVRDILQSFGRLDVIVHGASPRIHPVKVGELRYSDIEAFVKVYVGGALALVSSALPGMIERKFGRFIFLGTSFLFGVPPVGLSAYVSAKHALWGLVRCVATELGPAGITANMISPAMTVTDLTAHVPARVKEVEAYRNPRRRLATPSDTAELVAFLASDVAGYVNGANLPVTGGPT